MEAKRRWSVLSLRVLLLLILAVGIATGLLVRDARRQRAAVAAVKAYGGFVHYDWQYAGMDGGNLFDLNSRPPGPAWLRGLVGDEYFQKVTWVGLVRDAENGKISPTGRGDDAVMPHLRAFPKLKWLQVWRAQASDAGLANLAGSVELEQLLITAPEGLTARGLSHLERLPRLINLQINHGKLDNSCLIPIGKLAGLTHLSLLNLPITHAGLAHLRGLNRLESLRIRPSARGDADEGLEYLAGMTKMKSLDISGVPATDRGLAFLEAMPLDRLTLAADAPKPQVGIRRILLRRPKLALNFEPMPPSPQPVQPAR